MSTSGVGEIVAGPAAVIGAAAGVAVAGAALLATAAVVGGGVAVYQAGKGVIACGRKVGEVVQEHAARQRQLYQDARDYDAMLLGGAGQAAGLQMQAEARQRQEMEARIREYRMRSARPLPKMPEELAPRPVPVPDADQPPVRLLDAADLAAAVRQVEQELQALQSLLDSIENPDSAWHGLVYVGDQRQLLHRSEADFERMRPALLQGEAARPDQPVSLQDVRHDLRAMRAELTYRIGEAQNNQERRLRAAADLEKAAEELLAKSQALEGQRELAPGLALADQMLRQAEQFFKSGDYLGAQQQAGRVIDYLKKVQRSVDDLRRANLASAIQGLRSYLEGFAFPPSDTLPGKLQQMIVQAEQQLRAGQLDECRRSLDQAQPAADELAVEVGRRLKTVQRDGAARMVSAALQQMGYQVSPAAVRQDGAVEMKAVRADGAYFLIAISLNGLVQYKAEKFGTRECASQARELFDRLRREGMMVEDQPQLNVEEMESRLTETMLRQGFTVRVETQPDGRVTLIGEKPGGEAQRQEIGHDLPGAQASALGQPGSAAVGDPQQQAVQAVQRDRRRAHQRRQENQKARSKQRAG